MRKVVVTGGSGFVGRWMEKTIPRGTIATFLSGEAFYSSNWKFMSWDAVVHLAPISPLPVINHVAKQSPGARLLFASSGAVYSKGGDYATTKRAWERMVQESGTDWVIARLFTFVGKWLKNKYAITNFIDDARSGRAIVILGDGKTVRTYLHGEDLGRWMWRLLDEGHGCYDVGSEIEYTLAEVARAVAEVFPAKIFTMNRADVPTTRYVPDITCAKALGCRETIDLKAAIKREMTDESI